MPKSTAYIEVNQGRLEQKKERFVVPKGRCSKIAFFASFSLLGIRKLFPPSRKKGGRNSKVALNECQKSKMERKRLGVLKDRIQFSPPAPRRIVPTPLGGSGILCWGGGHAHQYVTVGRRGEGEEKPTQPRCKGENGILVWITICLERGGRGGWETRMFLLPLF